MRELLFDSLVRAILLLLALGGRTSAFSQSSPCYSPDGVIASGTIRAFSVRTRVLVAVVGRFAKHLVFAESQVPLASAI
jgi:hypothetical protein